MVRRTRVGRSPRGRNPSIRVQIPASPCLIFRVRRNQAEFLRPHHVWVSFYAVHVPSCRALAARPFPPFEIDLTVGIRFSYNPSSALREASVFNARDRPRTADMIRPEAGNWTKA